MRPYLESLSMAGYCSYDDDLERNRMKFSNLNVIIGANGAGKSNFISFLEMIGYMMTGALGSYTAKHGYADSLLYFGRKTTEEMSGEVKIYDPQRETRDSYSFSLGWNVQGGLYFTKETMSYQDTWHSQPYLRDFGTGQREAGIVDSTNSTERVLCGLLRGLRVFHFNDTSLSSRIKTITNLSKKDYLYSDGGNLAAFLYRLQSSETEIACYQRIERFIRRAMPQFGRFELTPDEAGYLALNWMQKDCEETFGPHQLSDGSLRFIALTTLLLQPPSTAPMTIILDEPEIGLHPYALSILSEELRIAAKNSQIILATQSPALLNEFAPEDIITADYDEKRRCSVLRRHTEAELGQWLEEYTMGELWEKNVLGGLPL